MSLPDETSGTAEADPKPQSRAASLLLEVVQTVLLTLLIFFSVRAVVQNFRVEGGSMEPTLQSGQLLIISKLAYLRVDDLPFSRLLPEKLVERRYLFGGPRRGDVVVFQAPGYGQKDFIKRVVGLPGDEIRIIRGIVYVNGQPLDEPYITHRAYYDYPHNGQPFKVPPDRYFVLGDNRPNSSDSHLGWTVQVDEIVGKAWVSYWPPSEWGVLREAAYANLQ